MGHSAASTRSGQHTPVDDTSIDNVIAHIAEEFSIVRHEERLTNTRLAYGTPTMLINASKAKCNVSFETDISMRGVKFDAHHADWCTSLSFKAMYNEISKYMAVSGIASNISTKR